MVSKLATDPEAVVVRQMILETEKIDPNFRERVRLHLIEARKRYKEALEDLTVSPEEVIELAEQVQAYGIVTDVGCKMELEGLEPQTKEDVFAEANKNAQLQEAERVGLI